MKFTTARVAILSLLTLLAQGPPALGTAMWGGTVLYYDTQGNTVGY